MPKSLCGSQQTGKLSKMGLADQLPCLLRNLCAGQEATVRTRHRTIVWLQIGKGVRQGCRLSPCLFNLNAEYITWNAVPGWSTSWNQECLKKCQQLQICRWHHPYWRKWRGTKSLLMKVKEENGKAGLKLNIQKMKIMASGLITSWQIDEETVETVTDSFFPLAWKSLAMQTVGMKLKDDCSLEEKLWST